MNKEFEFFSNSIGDFTLRRRLINIFDFIPKQGSLKILDFGCGEGVYTYALSKFTNHKITALDYDKNIISNLNNLNLNKDVKKIILDGEKDAFPFQKNQFDIIILSEVLEHVNDDVNLLNKLYKYLNINGHIIITVPNFYYPISIDPLNGIRRLCNLGHFNPKNTFLGGMWSYDHKRLYKKEDINRLISCMNFKVVNLVGLTRYVFPFYYHLIRTVKIFIDKSPNGYISSSLNKFNPKKNFISKIFKFFYKIFELFDSFNSNYTNIDFNFVTYLLILKKKTNDR